jgi:hypothetical protein
MIQKGGCYDDKLRFSSNIVSAISLNALYWLLNSYFSIVKMEPVSSYERSIDFCQITQCDLELLRSLLF